MAEPSIKLNSVHALAVVNAAGLPEVGEALPSAHLSLDADGNLRTSAVATIGGSVEISNDVGNPVPVNGTVEITNDVGNPIPISAASLPLPTGAATAALQTQPGVDIGDVTVNNTGANPVPTTLVETTTVPTQIVKVVAATGTPEALAADGTLFKTAMLIANKAVRTANTGKVWLGVTAGDGTQPLGLDSGDTWQIDAPPGQNYDLSDLYLDVETAGDGVVIIYA